MLLYPDFYLKNVKEVDIKLLKDNKKLNEIDKNLIIFIAKISKEQEQIIENKKISNYYKICDKDGKTMDYCKIKDIGVIKNIIFTEKIPLLSIRIKDKTVTNNPPKIVTAHKGMLSKNPQSSIAVIIS